jgi:predicted dehydrogenase
VEAVRVKRVGMKAVPYRVGIIGCGRVAWLLDTDPLIPNKPVTHMGAYRSIAGIEVVSGSDARVDRLHAFSREFGIDAVYLDYQEMLAKEDLDIVSICAYAPDRYRMVVDTVNAGVKGIWCEKAFATSLDEAEAMKKLCDEQGVTLIVDHTRRFTSDYRYAKKLLHDGAIGEPVSVVCHFSGSLVHTGTHAYDILRYFFGDAVWVEAILEAPTQRIGSSPQQTGKPLWHDGGGYGFIAFDAGVYATVHGDSKNYFIFEFDIMGTDGRLRIGNWLFELYEARESEKESGLRELRKKETAHVDSSNPFIGVVNHLLDCMEGRAVNISSPQDGKAALEIALAMQQSHSLGGTRVRLPLQERTLRVMSR